MKFGVRLAVVLVVASALLAQQPTAGGFQISGVVVNGASGEPLSRTRVQILSTDERTKTQAMVTGANGRFQFEHLAQGKYQLIAQRAGYPTQSFDQHEAYSSAIAVGPEKKSTGLVFRLKPEGVISGTIFDEANEAVRDAEVVLFHRGVENGQLSTHVTRQARSNDQGAYHFEQLMEGEYLVAVKARPWYAQNMALGSRRVPANPELDVAFPLTFYPGATDAEGAATIKIRSGDRVSADFVLRAVPAVRLLVRSSSRQLSAHLTQRIFEDYETFIQTQNTFENEAFTLAGIAPGQYVLRIDTPEGPDRTQDVTITDESSIDAEATKGIGTVNVAGIVSSYGGALPSRMVIQLESRSPRQTFGAQVASDGKFEIKQVQPGNYDVRLSDNNSFVAQMVASGASVNGRMVRIGKSDVTLALEISQGTGRITGTVMRDDSPQTGAMVLLVPDNAAQNTMLFRRDQSDSDGTFTLSDVVPGHYSLVAIMDGWELPYQQAGVLNPYMAKAESVTVTAKAKYNVKVTVQR